MEIERKFWLEEFPTEYPELVHLEMKQGYLCSEPVTVRIRSVKNYSTNEYNYVLCIKSKGTLSRTEIEKPLSEQEFNELAALLDRTPVNKDYHAYKLPDGNILECSNVDFGNFLYAEVEFKNEEDAVKWQPLDCLGAELTYDKRFTMGAYYRNGKVPDEYRSK